MVLRPELLGEFQAYAEKQTGVSKVGAAGGFYDVFFVCVKKISLKFARELDIHATQHPSFSEGH